MKIQISPAPESLIIMERRFNAAPERVWAALTDPQQVAIWYGGHGFQNPVCEMDVRVGGRWRHVMRTPDGVDYPMEFEFLEVLPPETLAWRPVGSGPERPGPHAPIMRVTLQAVGSQTQFRLVATFASPADRDAALEIGFTTNIKEGAEKLGSLLLPPSTSATAQ